MPVRRSAGGFRLICRADLRRRDRGETQAQECFGALDQAERYSRGFSFKTGESAGGPWDAFRVPYLYATNGRPYLKQIETESGIWFRDARKATNQRRPLVGWPTPDGLKAQLDIDRDIAHASLKVSAASMNGRCAITGAGKKGFIHHTVNLKKEF